jgi:AbiV family abortive infection protein
MQKTREYNLTLDLLDAYQIAALNNARELLEEAKLLLGSSHFARAYFLALASIEEAGKAYISFEAKGRNLCDIGLCNKIKERLEDHSSKIDAAFLGWISQSTAKREAIQKAVDLIVDLKNGREKSMYIDVGEDGKNLSIPREIVRPVAAGDCVKLAENCIHYTDLYVKNNLPAKSSTAKDKLLCIRPKTFTEMLNIPDFWEFYLSYLKQDNRSFEDAATTYHDCYYKKHRLFKTC